MISQAQSTTIVYFYSNNKILALVTHFLDVLIYLIIVNNFKVDTKHSVELSLNYC